MADRTVMLRIGANITGLQSQMRAAQQSVSSFTKQASADLARSARTNREAWESVGGTLTVAGGAVAALGVAAAKTGVEYNTLQQTTKAALTTVLGSASAAADQMDRLDEFARTSPFSKQTFITAQQQLLAFGVEAEKVVPYLDAIQDAVAATGGSNQEISELATIFAKIQGSAKITAEDLNEFGIRGVNAAELIGEQMGKTGAQIRDDISSGSLDAQVAMDALAAGMTQNFDGAADGVKDTFDGAVDRVKAAWRDLSAELAEPLVSADGGGALVDLANDTADLVRQFQALPEPVKGAIAGFAGVTGAAALAGGSFLLLAPRVIDTYDSFRTLQKEHPRVASGLGRVGRNAAIATGALGALAIAAAALESTAPDVTLGVEEMRSRLRALAEDGAAANQVFGDLNSTWVNFEGFSADSSVVKDAEAFQELLRQMADPGFIGAAQQQLAKLMPFFYNSSDLGQFEQRLAGINTELAGMASGGSLSAATDAFSGLTDAYKLTDEQAGSLLASLPEFRDALIGQADAAGMATDDATLLKIALGEVIPAQQGVATATDAAKAAVEGMTGATDENSEAIAENLSLIAKAAGVILSEREAQRSLEAAFDDATAAIEANGKTLDVTTEKGRANQSALDAVADGAWGVAESMYAAGASSKDIAARMQEARDGFIRTAMSAGHTKAEARELADQLGLIPSDVESILRARDQASGTIDRIKGELNGLQDKTITITTIRQVLGSDEGGPSQYVMRRAGGGPAIGPGTATSDSIPALLSNGEHVWTASEVQAAGGHAAMYQMRSAAQSGLLRFASGGAVGQAETALRRAQRSSLAARRALADARQAERRARLESTKREAEKRVAKAEQLLDQRQDAVNEARGRLERLREEASSLRTDLRRGNVRDSVTGGLSGALGVTDQLRDLASSGDVSRFGSRRLNNVAGSAEKALTSLYKQADRIDKRIESATNSLQKWQGIADGVSNSISGAFSLGDVSGGVNPWSGAEQQATGSELLAASQAYQEKARKLVVKLRALQDAGYGTAILQEVAAQGVDGGVAMADALLSLSPKDRKALQASQSKIDFYAGRAGIAATDDQVTAAARAVEAAEAQARVIDKNIDKWAKKLGSAMASALGVKARASGGDIRAGGAYKVGEVGEELFIPNQSGYMLNARQTANLTATPQKVVNVYVTQNYPQAIPYQKGINKALQHAAEEVLG